MDRGRKALGTRHAASPPPVTICVKVKNEAKETLRTVTHRPITACAGMLRAVQLMSRSKLCCGGHVAGPRLLGLKRTDHTHPPLESRLCG